MNLVIIIIIIIVIIIILIHSIEEIFSKYPECSRVRSHACIPGTVSNISGHVSPPPPCLGQVLKNYVNFELHSYEMQTLDSFHFIDADLSLFLGFSDC